MTPTPKKTLLKGLDAAIDAILRGQLTKEDLGDASMFLFKLAAVVLEGGYKGGNNELL